MKAIIRIALIACLAQFGSAAALDYPELSAVKLLRSEKRFEEAIAKLQRLAEKTSDPDENFHYLNIAIEVASTSLKRFDLAIALSEKVADPGRRDYACLRVLSDFKRYDDALVRVLGKNIDEWHARCRGSAHLILAEIYQSKRDEDSAQEHRLKAIASQGAETVVRGNAANDAGQFCLRKGDVQGAEKLFREALEISPAYYAWRNASQIALSRLLIQDRRAKEAVSLFQSMDFLKVESPSSRGQLLEAYARALLAAGKKIKCVETFDSLLQSNISETWKERINKELDKMAEDF